MESGNRWHRRTFSGRCFTRHNAAESTSSLHIMSAHTCQHARLHTRAYCRYWQNEKARTATHTRACIDIKPFGILICYPVIRDKAFWMVGWKPIVQPVSPWWCCLLSYNRLCHDCVCVRNNRLKKLNESRKCLNVTVDMAARGPSGEVRWDRSNIWHTKNIRESGRPRKFVMTIKKPCGNINPHAFN